MSLYEAPYVPGPGDPARDHEPTRCQAGVWVWNEGHRQCKRSGIYVRGRYCHAHRPEPGAADYAEWEAANRPWR